MGCPLCDFKNIHKGHKIISIEDEESLKKENINLDSAINECNEYTEKIKKLREKIESEIEIINNEYDNIDKEITKFYEEKYQKLKNEENNLKEKLQNEVTKAKEKLEINLSYTNEVIRINERINKGIKIFNNEQEKNIIKTISYISKISQIQKSAKELLTNDIKNIKINFDIEKNDIIFKDYLINGILIPKNIQIKNIKLNDFEISWSIDDNILNKEKYLFRIELKEENSKGNFTKVYEDKNYNTIIKNLKINTYYEIRICSIVDNLFSSWSDIKKIRTDFINDTIILNNEDKNKLFNFLNPVFKNKHCYLNLLYRRGNDMSYKTFHDKCDNKGKTVIICKSKNEKFGGYTNINWESSDGRDIKQDGPFIFSINKNRKIEYNNKINHSIYLHKDHGPDFCWDFVFNTEKQMKVCICAPKDRGYAYSSEALVGDGTYKEIDVDEVEAFEIKMIN